MASTQYSEVPAPCPRTALRGWSLHPRATAILLVVLLAGVLATAWLPRDWSLARMLALYLVAFPAGMLVAGRAAIWQQKPDSGLRSAIKLRQPGW